jgi:hypothetical protein
MTMKDTTKAYELAAIVGIDIQVDCVRVSVKRLTSSSGADAEQSTALEHQYHDSPMWLQRDERILSSVPSATLETSPGRIKYATATVLKRMKLAGSDCVDLFFKVTRDVFK